MIKLARYLITLLLVTTPVIAEAAEPVEAEDSDPTSVVSKRPRRTTGASKRTWENLSETGLAPAWSYGLSLPISRFGFQRQGDGSYGGNVTPLQAGLGTSIFWNAIRNANGSVPVGVGAMLFGATDLSSRVSDSGLGIAIGPSFWDNHFAVMAGVDLYRRIGNQDTGLLMSNAGGKNGFARENVFLLLNFGIGLGKGAPGALKIAP
jgi:hypothetical protein